MHPSRRSRQLELTPASPSLSGTTERTTWNPDPAINLNRQPCMALEEPLPRYPTDGSVDNKACPCGVGESNRLCNVETDRSDPDRSVYVETYTAGETVTLRWRETIGHSGRWRIAIDPDGADMTDFNDNILLDIEDPSGNDGNTGNGNLWEVEITLPNTPCDNCTLQLVQVMDGNTTDLVPDPIGRSSYYQCADIELVEAGGDADTDADADSDTDTDADTDSDADTDLPAPPPEESGCTTVSGVPFSLGLVALLAVGRRRS